MTWMDKDKRKSNGTGVNFAGAHASSVFGLRLSWLAAGAVIVLAAAGLATYFVFRPAADARTIEANGQIRGTEVTLSARIPGIAEIVAVREGEHVKAGQMIAQIAARELEARHTQALAQVAAAESLVTAMEAQARALDETSAQARLGARVTAGTASHEVHRASEAVARALAEVAAAQAQATQDRKAYERFEKLLEQGFVSRNYLDEVSARLQASDARLAAARRASEEAAAARERAQAATGEIEIRERDVKRIAAERERVLASRDEARSQVAAARGRVAEIEAQLTDTRIVAPAAGTVSARLVEPGELVAAGRPVATLVDFDALYVRVYVPEHAAGRIRLGDPADISVDAFPGRVFLAQVSEIAQQAEFTPKDVHMKDEREKLVFAVKLRVGNPERLLKPGMPADAKIRAAGQGSGDGARH